MKTKSEEPFYEIEFQIINEFKDYFVDDFCPFHDFPNENNRFAIFLKFDRPK